MKKFAYIIDDRVNSIIYEYNKDFPDVRLEERYTKSILDKLVECDDSVTEGMDYNWDTGVFTEHIYVIPDNDMGEGITDNGNEAENGEGEKNTNIGQ